MKPIRVYERWSKLSFVVHRTPSGKMLWTLVFHQADGSRRWDRRLAWGELSCPPGTPESQDALSALSACLEQAREGREGPADASGTPPPEASAPPGGPRGDTHPGS